MAKNTKRSDKSCNTRRRNNNSDTSAKMSSKEPKEVEVNVNRDSINKADMKGNDPSWYNYYKELAGDAARLGFSWPVGNRLTYTFPPLATNITRESYDYFIPGVAALSWTPTIGPAVDQNSPINVAAQKLYAYQVYDISRNISYNNTDLMLMILAMDSCYSFYAMMVRAYGLLTQHPATNKYMPSALFAAMGLNYSDFLDHISEFRYFINYYSSRLARINVPSDIAYIARHVWMNSNIFLDSSTTKAQMYLYVQRAYYQYDETSLETGSQLVFKEFTSGSAKTFAQTRQFAESLMNAVVGSEDIGIISGDVLKTFGADKIYTFAPITDDYQTIPVYSPEVLSQFENCTIMGNVATNAPGTYQNPNIVQVQDDLGAGPYLIQHIHTQSTSNTVQGYKTAARYLDLAASSKVLNMHIENPSVDDVLVATRMTAMATPYIQESTTTQQYLKINNCGSEIVNFITLYTYAATPTTTPPVLAAVIVADPYLWMDPGVSEAHHHVDYGMRFLHCLSNFDWHPSIPVVTSLTQDSVTTYNPPITSNFDADNIMMLEWNDLSRLHEVALSSLFAVRSAWMFNK